MDCLRCGPNVGQTAEGYVCCGHEVLECRGLEHVTSQEIIFNASLLEEEDLIPPVVFMNCSFFLTEVTLIPAEVFFTSVLKVPYHTVIYCDY